MTEPTNHPDERITSRPAYDWRKRAENDARDGRFDPPAHPDDRAEYDAGYIGAGEATP